MFAGSLYDKAFSYACVKQFFSSCLPSHVGVLSDKESIRTEDFEERYKEMLPQFKGASLNLYFMLCVIIFCTAMLWLLTDNQCIADGRF
jgi:hypothetical protein